MKRINNEEKRQLGFIIHYYRNMYFRSNMKNAEEFKQVNFCRDICSQTQLSRLENGEPVKDNLIYESLLSKLNLSLEKVSPNDYNLMITYFDNILTYQNDDSVIINYNDYVMKINYFQNIFKKNIIYTHYNYALEFILSVLNEDLEEADYIIDDVENTLDIFSAKQLILTLQYIGNYYYLKKEFNKANKYYLSAIEHMHKNNINNPIIYIEVAENEVMLNKELYAVDNLNKALSYYLHTHHYEKLARIYYCYGLIYLINKHLVDGIDFLHNSLHYSKLKNKSSLILKNYYLIAVGYYLYNMFDKALNYVLEAEKFMENDEGKILRFIISMKKEPTEGVILKTEIYYVVTRLYLEKEDREEFFEKNVKDYILELPDAVRLIVLYDMYYYYKDNKKYKKALELIDTFLF